MTRNARNMILWVIEVSINNTLKRTFSAEPTLTPSSEEPADLAIFSAPSLAEDSAEEGTKNAPTADKTFFTTLT